MGSGFRGIDPAGLGRLAEQLNGRGADLKRSRQICVVVLRSASHAETGELSAAIGRTESWLDDAVDSLRWRVAAIAAGQCVPSGRGVPAAYVTAAHDRALIGAFLPSRFGLEAWSRRVAITRSRSIGRRLAYEYLNGKDVSGTLSEMSLQPDFEAVAAAFFNRLGPAATALIPQTVRYSAVQAADGVAQASRRMHRYAVAFSAATQSGFLNFAAADLFDQDDLIALRDPNDVAHLFTEPGLARGWLEFAARRIVLAEAYVPWVTSADAVIAVLTGLTSNPVTAAEVLSDDGSVETLLRRSTLLDAAQASAVGEALVAAATANNNAAGRVAMATIAAIGGSDVKPHPAVMRHLAVVGGLHLDELAWSLVAWEGDPAYQPRFVVERKVARSFLLEVVRQTEAYAVILAATRGWISDVIGSAGASTLADYTRRVSNRTDDIGLLLATIIGADRISGVEDAEESARRRTMLLDAIGGVVRVVAGLAGPATPAAEISVGFLRDGAAELMDVDPVAAAVADNDAFREAVLDELRITLHEAIGSLELAGSDARLDPQTLAERQGEVLVQILAAVYATMSQYEPQEFD